MEITPSNTEPTRPLRLSGGVLRTSWWTFAAFGRTAEKKLRRQPGLETLNLLATACLRVEAVTGERRNKPTSNHLETTAPYLWFAVNRKCPGEHVTSGSEAALCALWASGALSDTAACRFPSAQPTRQPDFNPSPLIGPLNLELPHFPLVSEITAPFSL